MTKRPIICWVLILLIVLLVWADCGEGESDSFTNSQLLGALSVITENLVLQPQVSEKNIRLKSSAPGWFWDSVEISRVGYTNILSHVVITGETATATVTFRVSGHQESTGTCPVGDGTWQAEGDFTLLGSGTVDFEKVNYAWRVANIPTGIILTSDENLAPSITAFSHSPQTLLRNSVLTVRAGISDRSNYTHGLYLVAARGFGYDSSAAIYYSRDPNYRYQHTQAIRNDAAIDNNFGAIHVWQVVQMTPSSYAVFYSCYIDYVVVEAPPI